MSFLGKGDFNLYHPLWGGYAAVQAVKADKVLEFIEAASLDPWLQPGTIMRDDIIQDQQEEHYRVRLLTNLRNTQYH